MFVTLIVVRSGEWEEVPFAAELAIDCTAPVVPNRYPHPVCYGMQNNVSHPVGSYHAHSIAHVSRNFADRNERLTLRM